MNTDINKIKQLGKDSIIKLGYLQAQQIYGRTKKNINISNFDKITVSANSKHVWVTFLNPVIYLPINSAYYNGLGINITDNSASCGIIANPVDYKYKDTDLAFYSPTKESKKAIEFVLNAVGVKTTADKKKFIENMVGGLVIRENKNYYDIEVVSEYMDSNYKIDKTTGKIYDEMHAHLIPDPNKEKDPMVEIK